MQSDRWTEGHVFPVDSSAGDVLSDRRKAQPSKASASTTPAKLLMSSFLRNPFGLLREGEEGRGWRRSFRSGDRAR